MTDAPAASNGLFPDAPVECIGIDGARGGWVVATTTDVRLETSLSNVITLDRRQCIAIDMPIGLVDHGRRDCDVQAREALKPARHNSVFWTATRPAVMTATSQSEASRINIAHGAKGVSAQAYNLFDKIREIDTLLRARPSLQDIVFEVHPELVFASWNAENGGSPGALQPMTHAKKSSLGAFDRLSLLLTRYAREPIEQARARYPASQVADDDIVDAYAALYAAERIVAGRHVTLPGDPPPRDAHGMPVRICY